MKSAYESRRPEELKVLTQWFPKESLPQELLRKAKYLDIILYSKEQIQKEDEAIGQVDPNKDIDYEYGIISIKSQDVDHELPM